MSSSLADKLNIKSAPAIARLLLGGSGAQTSSQISTPKHTPFAVRKTFGLGSTIMLFPAKLISVGFSSLADANHRLS